MAKYLRYQGEFLSVSGVTWRVEMHQEADKAFDKVGVLEFDAEEPLTIDWATKTKEEVVCGATATLKIISPGDRTYEDLYSIEVGRVRLDVYRDGKLYWSGCIDTETYEEPYEQLNGYTVTLTFTDFGVLDRLKYDLTDMVTLEEIVNYSLYMSGIMVGELDDSLISTLIPRVTSVANDIQLKLSYLKVRSDNFYDEDGEALTIAEVLKGVLQPLGLKMIQRCGKVYVYDLNSLYHNGQHSPIEWDGASQTMSVDRVYNNAKVTWSPYAQSGNLLPEACWPEDVPTPASAVNLNNKDSKSLNGAEYWSYYYENKDLDKWSDTTDSGFSLWTINRGDNATLNHSDIRFFRIVPQLDGSEAEGIAVQWVSVTGGQHNGGYSFGLYPNGLSASLSAYNQVLGTKLMTSKEASLPYVENPSALVIRVGIDLLLDVRFNPFEGAENLNLGVKKFKDRYETWKKQGNFVYIPVRIKFQPDGSNDVYVWDNRDAINAPIDNPIRSINATYGQWVKQGSEDVWGYIAYYDSHDRKDECGVMGWKKNRPAINPHTDDTLSILTNAEDGQYIPYPVNGGGKIWVELYTGWLYRDGGEDISELPKEYSALRNYVAWALIKLPELEIMNAEQFGREINTEDVEYSAELNTVAKEAIELSTICGTSAEGVPTARGAYFRTANSKQLTEFIRAGRQTQVEDLLIGTLYSQYAQRRTTLSGEAVLLREPIATYTDANQGDKLFMCVGDVQNLRADTSDAMFIELRPDEYKRNNE